MASSGLQQIEESNCLVVACYVEFWNFFINGLRNVRKDIFLSKLYIFL